MQSTPTSAEFLGLPNLLPNTGGYRTHRRSRSGIETRHPPDLTHDVDLLANQQVASQKRDTMPNFSLLIWLTMIMKQQHHTDTQPVRKKTVTSDPGLEEASLLVTAIEAFVKDLGLENEELLKDKVEVREIPANTYLMQEESHKVCLTSS